MRALLLFFVRVRQSSSLRTVVGACQSLSSRVGLAGGFPAVGRKVGVPHKKKSNICVRFGVSTALHLGLV